MLLDFNRLVNTYGKPNGILHVGANKGQEALIYHQHVSRVVWVEALPSVYIELVRHVNGYGDQCILACVGDVDGKDVTFHESNNEAQSSSFLNLGTHKTAHPEVKYIKDHNMKTVRLDTLYKSHNISGLDFLAMDIQGAELLALKGLGQRLNEFKWVYLEVNIDYLYEGCALLPEITEYLKSFGFKKMEEKIYRQWGWGDAFYTR